MLAEDTLFYWTHRVLHLPMFYTRFHKKHHEYTDNVSIASEYAHPVENIFGNLLPSSIGIQLLGDRIHLVSALIWIFIRIAKTTDAHSGYEFPFSAFRLLPFALSAANHDFHHTHNVGNYGSFLVLWDTFMETNRDYLHHQDEKQPLKDDSNGKVKENPVNSQKKKQ